MILDSLHNKIFTFLFLVVCTNSFGALYEPKAIDSIRITYGHLDGYAIYLSEAIYLFKSNAYVLIFPGCKK